MNAREKLVRRLTAERFPSLDVLVAERSLPMPPPRFGACAQGPSMYLMLLAAVQRDIARWADHDAKVGAA